MKHTIKVPVTTCSNLLIGGSPVPFEIGGIDQWTAVDSDGFPCIPASSWKGALRMIVKEDAERGETEDAQAITRFYQAFLKREWKENEQRIRQLWGEETEGIERVHARYDRAIKNASPCDLFGIREFNNTPKLLFNDLRLKAEYRDLKKCFSIDAKNSIDSNGTEPKSNPRTYKTARTGLVFEGEIEFYQFDQAGFDVEQCRRYIMRNLEKFNDGIYRLGNSKSRGYGKIRVSFTEDGGEKRGKL